MGGYGSGGYRWGSMHVLAGSCFIMDAKQLGQGGLFNGPNSCQWRWKNSDLVVATVNPGGGNSLYFEIERGGQRSSQWVQYCASPCRFGGVRYWLRCPECGRRVFKLFLYPHCFERGTNRHVNVFWCRLCRGVSYSSKNVKARLSKAQMRAFRIKRRLKDFSKYWEIPLERPKWMRKSSYARYLAKFNAACELADVSFVQTAAKQFPELFVRRQQDGQADIQARQSTPAKWPSRSVRI